MFVFTINDMRVSSQSIAVMQALKHVDENASVHVDLVAHEAQITPTTAGATEFSDAIIHAGFNPVLMSNARSGAESETPMKVPFEDSDHGFSVCSGSRDAVVNTLITSGATTFSKDAGGCAPTSIAGVSRLTSVLPAEALGPLAHKAQESGQTPPESIKD
jgi:hypothetical protein